MEEFGKERPLLLLLVYVRPFSMSARPSLYVPARPRGLDYGWEVIADARRQYLY